MSDITKCDKCRKTKKKNDKMPWTKGNVSPDGYFYFDDKKTQIKHGFVGYFDLCPKCAKPLLGYMKSFLKNKNY